MPSLPDALLINVMTYAGDDLRCYMLAITVWITLENLFPLLDSLKVVLSSGDLKNIGDVTKLSFVRNLSIRCRQGITPDISTLRNLINLTSLNLSFTAVSKSDIDQLRRALPDTDIHR